VDDNRDCADSTVLLFRAVGLEAKACYDGPSALRVAEEYRPTVCLLDLNMPGMDGDEVAVRLHGQPWFSCVLVAITARSDEESCARIAAAGFHLHLVKPVDPKNLISVVYALFCRTAFAGLLASLGNDLLTSWDLDLP